MELFQLEYFLEAARQRNFTRAAARLHLAQAALSEQIRKLESELGTPLFNRGRRKTVLNAAGVTLRRTVPARVALRIEPGQLDTAPEGNPVGAWQGCVCPTGAMASSPGLGGSSHPGRRHQKMSRNRNGVATGSWHAEGHHPVGIAERC